MKTDRVTTATNLKETLADVSTKPITLMRTKGSFPALMSEMHPDLIH